jgi:4-alpha-glucanotransferase
MPFNRSSGLLLHISSLPSYGGIGDMGPAAYEFADFLAASKQQLWQVLPLSPTGYGNSPYSSLSAFAGNPLLISLEKLSDWGWIDGERIANLPGRSGNVDFEEVRSRKLPLIEEAARNFLKKGHIDPKPDDWVRFEKYCVDNASWLNEWSYYNVLRRKYELKNWNEWPAEVAQREPAAMENVLKEHGKELAVEQVIQYAFDEQWKQLRIYCAQHGIRFIGDVAIFVSYDSADAWTNRDIFELDDKLQPIRVSGVPPDYFSITGQRWGNPLYRWDVLAERKFDWWVRRIGRSRSLYDIIRLDHFRGFEAYWAIPATEETATRGEWIKAPGEALFLRLREVFGELPFVAEDLGLITPEVEQLRQEFNFPGMRILQFGFGSRESHNYLPHRYEPNSVVYTGTHDNDTTRGWWENGTTETERAAATTYLGNSDDGIVWSLIRSGQSSVADVSLVPLQDVIEIGSEGRMNTPSHGQSNWSWRCPEGALTEAIAEKLKAITVMSDRDVRPTSEGAQATPSRDVKS